MTYYVTFLGEQRMREQSIKTYIAALHHVQITMGLPDPLDTSSLPRLSLVLTGIKRSQAEAGRPPRKLRLPITLPILERIRSLWNNRPMPQRRSASLGSSVLGEITVPSREAFEACVHLGWGEWPSTIKLTRRQSGYTSAGPRLTNLETGSTSLWGEPGICCAQ